VRARRYQRWTQQAVGFSTRLFSEGYATRKHDNKQRNNAERPILEVGCTGCNTGSRRHCDCPQRFRYGKHHSHRLTKQADISTLIDQYTIATPAKLTFRYTGEEAPPSQSTEKDIYQSHQIIIVVVFVVSINVVFLSLYRDRRRLLRGLLLAAIATFEHFN
jgi:hypothetical protein